MIFRVSPLCNLPMPKSYARYPFLPMLKLYFLAVCSIVLLTAPQAALLAETPDETKWRLLAEMHALEADSLRSKVGALEKKLELQGLEIHEKEIAVKTPSHSRETPTVTADGMSMAPMALAEDSDPGTSDTTKPAQTTKTTQTSTTATSPPTRTSRLTYNYQVLKPTTRVFFDGGGDDLGEVDYFKDGDLGLSIDFLTFSLDYALAPGIWVSGFAGGGLLAAATGGEATGNAAVFMWNAGLSLSFEKLPVALEIGFMQGISASESLHGDDRNDSAFFIGMSLDKVIKKNPLVGERGDYLYAPPQG